MRTIFVTLLLFCSTILFASTVNDNDKYKTFGLIWGLLKYHHPEVSKGKYDWDGEFVKQFEVIERINDAESLNSFYKKWIGGFGTINNEKPEVYGDGFFTANEDYAWFETSGFDIELKSILMKLKNGRHKAGHFYVKIPVLSQLQDFSNEKGFSSFDFTIKSHRLLDLFSFWNVTQYWNLNKYMFDENWMDVLDKNIPVFMAAGSKLELERAKARLFTKIHDSHAWYASETLLDEWPRRFAPITIQNVNGSLVITGTPAKHLLQENGLVQGDVITAINGKTIMQLMDENIEQYYSVSNRNRCRNFSYLLLRGNDDSAVYSIVHTDGSKGRENSTLLHQLWQRATAGGDAV